jgi:hypothetical protein
MGAAAVVALAVFGFILLDSETPSGGATVVANVTVPPAKTDPSSKPRPDTSFKPPPETLSKTSAEASPKVPPVTPLKTPPEMPPITPPKPPPETPSYQGRVVDWIGGGTILVPGENGKGVRFIQLHGVQDLMGSQQQTNDIRRQLDAYLDANGRQVACFRRTGGDPRNPPQQCFIGNNDIARWAVGHHLAKPTADAPPDYREASQ